MKPVVHGSQIKTLAFFLEKILVNGGTIRVPSFDVPGVGRSSLVADSAGANFAITQFVQP